MLGRIVLLSGPVGSGKSELATRTAERYGAVRISTRELIRRLLPSTQQSRRALQRAGDRLDQETDHQWIRDALLRDLQDLPEDTLVLVDSVRTRQQITAIRSAFGPRVVHAHVTAPEATLAARYAERTGAVQELGSYDAVRSSRTERNINGLTSIADVVIDTHRCHGADALVRLSSHLGLYGPTHVPLVDVLVGGEYGSEGKGHVVAYLAPEYDVLVRVGGPNAGHKVYEEPRPYTFHLLPSGSRANDQAQLMLGPGSVLALPQLLQEIADCNVAADRLWIDPNAMVITDEDRANEERIEQAIGSTRQGVGAATVRKIQRLPGEFTLARDAPELRPYVRETRQLVEDSFALGRRILLEGTQGTALSLHHGQYPYVTSRDTTVSGCLSEAGIPPHRVRRVVMVCRTYPIRVGGETGPMAAELTWQEIADRSGISLDELEQAEVGSTTHRPRRVGEFDWDLLRQAATLNGPTDIALTFADYLSVKNREARRFEQLQEPTIHFIDEVERVACAPVSLIGTRFDFRSIIDRRAW